MYVRNAALVSERFTTVMKVIISGKSSPEVLTDDGIMNWARSIGL